MLNTDTLRDLFHSDVALYTSELGLSVPWYYKAMRTKQTSLTTITKICGYFDIPVQDLIIVPEEYYQ